MENFENRIVGVEASVNEAVGELREAATRESSGWRDIVSRIPKEIAEKRIVVARGSRRNDYNWVNFPTTFGGLVKMMSKFSRGEKDGPCITGGEVNGSKRLAVNVTANYLLMFDSDYGHTLDELQASVEKSGYACLMYTTYSHLKTVSEIGEGAIQQAAKKLDVEFRTDMDEADLIRLVKQVLTAQDKLHPRIIASISSAERIQKENVGAVISFTHDPLPRARLVFILDAPFQFFLPDVAQRDRINEWKDRYKGFAKKYKLTTDGTCIDPSRLMYLPRIAPGADESIYEMRWVDGKLVTFWQIPRETDLKKAEINPYLAASREMGVRDGGQAGVITFKTKGMAKFLKGPSTAFEAADWVQSIAPEDVREGGSLDKLTVKCPNDHNHNNPEDQNDKGFFVVNASMSENGWIMQCSHNTCKQMCEEATGRPNDRAWYLDLMCQKHGIEDMRELSDYYAGWVDEEAVEEEAKRQESELIEEMIAALTPEVSENELSELLARVARVIRDTPLRRHELVVELAKRTGKPKGVISDALKKASRDLKAADRAVDTAASHGELLEAFERLNDECGVTNFGGKACVSYIDDNGRVEFMSKTDFELMKSNLRIWVDGERVAVARRWLEWDGRRTYGGVEFNPAVAGDRVQGGVLYRNLFRGFARMPVDGDWSLFRRHLFKVICDRDPYLFAWAFNWYADIFRDPANKKGTALVLRGDKGTGKSKMFEVISRICPNNALNITKQEQAFGRFNSHLAESLLVNLEEAYWAGNKPVEGAFKEEITGKTRLIEPKGLKSAMVANCTRYQIISNEDWVVPATADERRFCVLDVSNAHRQDGAWFSAIDRQMGVNSDEQGTEAMLFDFLNVAAPAWIDLRKPPRTRALLDQIERSQSPEHRWFRHILETGKVVDTVSRTASWPPITTGDRLADGIANFQATASAGPQRDAAVATEGLSPGALVLRKNDVYDSFKEWFEKNGGGRHIPSAETLGRFLKRVGVDTDFRVKIGDGSRPRCYHFAPIAELRASFAANHGAVFDDSETGLGLSPNDAPAAELESWRRYGEGGERPD